jgi:hypothetical protein
VYDDRVDHENDYRENVVQSGWGQDRLLGATVAGRVLLIWSQLVRDPLEAATVPEKLGRQRSRTAVNIRYLFIYGIIIR